MQRLALSRQGLPIEDLFDCICEDPRDWNTIRDVKVKVVLN